MMGNFCINTSDGIKASRDKLRSLQVMAKHGIDMPITGYASHTMDIHDVIEKVKGEKFEVRSVIEEIRKNVTDVSREEMGLIVDVLRENYNNARNFGLFKNEQSLEALEEGRGTKIMAGPWRGESLELGHFISPEINDTIQFHFVNRLILPETDKAAMEFADITKDVRDRADRMKRAKVLDVGSCDSIIRQYNTLRELSSRN